MTPGSSVMREVEKLFPVHFLHAMHNFIDLYCVSPYLPFFSGLNSPKRFNWSSYSSCSNPLIMLVSLFCTILGSSIFFFKFSDQNYTLYSNCNLNMDLYKGSCWLWFHWVQGWLHETPPKESLSPKESPAVFVSGWPMTPEESSLVLVWLTHDTGTWFKIFISRFSSVNGIHCGSHQLKTNRISMTEGIKQKAALDKCDWRRSSVTGALLQKSCFLWYGNYLPRLWRWQLVEKSILDRR